MTGLDRFRQQGHSQQKIRPEHLGRPAIVYVRQSSRQQVIDHSESTRLQYALAGRAAALGWARSQVVVIDDDLGVSAATPDLRKGFARLVTEVTMGRAGIVLGIEMSRLARTGRAAGTGTSCWVRHEALCIRAEMEGLRRRVVAAARLARSEGVTRVNQWLKPRNGASGSNLADMGWDAVRDPIPGGGSTP